MATVDQLTASLTCPRCGEAQWTGTDAAVRCARCGADYPIADGVLDLTSAYEDAVLAREREAAYETEQNPALGGINDRFADLSAVDGPLRSAIVALPYGDGSRYYREPGYFANVHGSVAAFDFLLKYLDARPGQRLLDLGADVTWSTAQMARRGLRCTAVDINHHLSAARLFFEHYGIAYGLIRADMTRVSLRDEAFDVVLAINALHHGSDLGQLAANIARMLRPGGRLGFIEPYCASDEDRRQFGAAQIEAGINEHTYRLDEWHQAFTRAGLAVTAHRVCDSFAAVYEKSRGSGPVAADSEPGLFSAFYRGELAVEPPAAGRVSPDTREALIRIRNDGDGAWGEQSLYPVRASYHLYRLDSGSPDLLAFDNPRTPLPHVIDPGGHATVAIPIRLPDEPGQYVAEVDLVHEGVRWFSECGMKPLQLRFTVTRSRLPGAG